MAYPVLHGQNQGLGPSHALFLAGAAAKARSRFCWGVTYPPGSQSCMSTDTPAASRARRAVRSPASKTGMTALGDVNFRGSYVALWRARWASRSVGLVRKE
eukprot:scaffold2917_cov191-Amphora_coffeaeformis.AAC.34